ncbi:hypothetical protein [Actinomadura sp. WMMB 499]|uniref:hypothetical protein n=1 Tax=Actinomadura sp. WMMB 499 TaxID=1219491 RepID=UPI001C3FB480|nr:hypothetical protein [Actinomadura sp. WMMB 499]
MMSELVAGIGLMAAGAAVAALGVGVISAGTGAFGLETRTFTRIDCVSVRADEGGTVWHCKGESPEQVRANDEAAERAMLAALRAHREGVPRREPRQRTRLTFVDHDGRNDPERVTASRVGGRWIAHSGNVVGTGVLLTIGGAAAVGWGGYRTRRARGDRTGSIGRVSLRKDDGTRKARDPEHRRRALP